MNETPPDNFTHNSSVLYMALELSETKWKLAFSVGIAVREVFGWRQIKNRRELASLAGLTPTPYNSGLASRDQGISKAGNRRLRAMLIEIAWRWLMFQPDSSLSKWFQQRFGHGSKRLRRVGIVAVGRKLLVAPREVPQTRGDG
jgi:transposase